MSFLSRLLGTAPDPREGVRPLWHRVIELSRTRDFYAAHGVADTIDGRFDMVTTMLATTMLRMERSPQLARSCALVTELFVEDMDGQLRESGVGDFVVGKHMGKLMAALGGSHAASVQQFQERRQQIGVRLRDDLANPLGGQRTLDSSRLGAGRRREPLPQPAVGRVHQHLLAGLRVLQRHDPDVR